MLEVSYIQAQKKKWQHEYPYIVATQKYMTQHLIIFKSCTLLCCEHITEAIKLAISNLNNHSHLMRLSPELSFTTIILYKHYCVLDLAAII